MTRRPVLVARVVPVVAAVLVHASCSPSENAVPPDAVTVDTLASGAVHVVSRPEGTWALSGQEPWTVAEDLRIGVLEGDERYMFGSARNVFPDPSGRIWVLDSGVNELRLYDRDGSFVRAVGGAGEGPGEFGFNTCATPGPDGDVWIESRGRWQRFDSAGTFLGEQLRTRSLGCGVMAWTTDGRFLAVTLEYDTATRERTSYYILHARNESGDVVPADTFPAPTIPESPRVRWVDSDGDVRITSYMPLSHRAFSALGPRGDFWISEGGGSYRIRRQSLEGDTLLVLERPYDPVPVPDSVRSREIGELERDDLELESGFDPDQIPRYYPPHDYFYLSTDGTLWVKRQIRDGRWSLDVFDPDGRYLGPVEPPADFDRMRIGHITSEYMYGAVRDELDVSYVVRLAIRKPGA